jgi:hypothetical protein
VVRDPVTGCDAGGALTREVDEPGETLVEHMQHCARWGTEHSERAVESWELLVSDATLLDGGLRAAFWCDNRLPLLAVS